jgi:hypothetical protein
MVLNFYLPEHRVVTMNAINIAFLMLGWFASCVWFYTLGVNAGYTDGRRAVRQQVEQASKVRA